MKYLVIFRHQARLHSYIKNFTHGFHTTSKVLSCQRGISVCWTEEHYFVVSGVLFPPPLFSPPTPCYPRQPQVAYFTNAQGSCSSKAPRSPLSPLSNTFTSNRTFLQCERHPHHTHCAALCGTPDILQASEPFGSPLLERHKYNDRKNLFF